MVNARAQLGGAVSKEHIVYCAVTMSPYAEYHLRPLGVAFRAAFQRGDYPGFKRVPGAEGPVIPFYPQQWHPYVGGAVVSTRPMWWARTLRPELPKPLFDDDRSNRAVLLFNDAATARQVAQLDAAYRRRYAWLYVGEDGTWILRMRWTGGTVSKREQNRQKRKHRRRWKVAPPQWPRDKWGKTLSTFQATRILGRAKVQALLDYPEEQR